jgi:MarR family transcriptional regulator, organic hydroperoxide resistance regulator
MKGRPSTTGVLDVMQALWGLAHALEARSKWMHRHLGITGPQRLLLRVIGESPGCSPGEASRTLSLNPGTVSRLAAGLERGGLVKRGEDRNDGRRQRLVLTRRGETLNRDHRGTVEAALQKVVQEAGPAQVRQAHAFLALLTETLLAPQAKGRGGRKGIARRPSAP